MIDRMIYCHVRYLLNPEGLDAFEDYARTWIGLVEKYGGTHQGFFVSGGEGAHAAVSFPGLGSEAPTNMAIAFFSFPDRAVYDSYRAKAAVDPECLRLNKMMASDPCFASYERAFLRPIGRRTVSQG